jgi:hypothetical protein
MLERHEQTIGLWAWVLAWVGLVVGQLHALSRFATADGKEDLEIDTVAWWAEPAADALSPLLDWADPDIVYVTYGKIWLPVFVAFTLCAAAVMRRRQPRGFEQWVWRVTVFGYGVACVSVFLDYWTQWTGNYNGDGIEGAIFEMAWLITIPGFLLTMLGSTALGLTLVVKRFRPLVPALLLLLTIPLALGILMFSSMGSAVLPVMFAFGLLGRRLARGEDLPSAAPTRRESRAREAAGLPV